MRPAWFSNPASVSAGPRTVEQHVADHPPRAGDRLQRQEPDPGQLAARDVLVEATEQLVPAAHRQHHGAAVDGFGQRIRLRREIGRDQPLLAVLAAADIEEVDARRYRVGHPDRDRLQLVAARAGPLGEHGDVAAVGVDVQVVGIEVPEADLHAARSQ